MEDFDVFTDEINYTKPFYCNVIHNFTKEIPLTPNGANYQNGKRLLAEECLADNDDLGCAFNLSEAVSASLRTLALYREDQLKYAQDSKLEKVIETIKTVENLKNKSQCNSKSSDMFNSLLKIAGKQKRNTKFSVEEEPFHKRYLKFTLENNIKNFRKILKELPKEWTVIQLSAPFNPHECLKPQEDYKCEINAIYLSVFTNEYLDVTDLGPFNVVIPAYEPKEGERPLFNELYSLLEENYKTIENAQSLNNKRLVQNYWNRREDIDLRMKSVIMIMDREWLGGWNSLLTGKLIDSTYRDRIMKLVDDTILDWGFVRLNQKQKILLYNLIESSGNLSSTQIKTCIRKILTEHGNPDDLRQSLDVKDCGTCSVEFNLPNELCLKCLSRCFQVMHNFCLVDGIKAFSDLAIQVRERDEWLDLKKAKRYPVILIVDEILDTFPWESLPILNTHPVSRMENIHYLYYLYKVHEKNFVNGYYMVGTVNGRYIINPEKNLDRMEKRMSSFIQYWCPQWKGVVGKMPEPQEYNDILHGADMFLYCGHGDGLQLSQGTGAGAPGHSHMLGVLAGCGSTRLPPAPPRAPPLATHHHYHTRHSPLVIGMLWEVTDLEVDKVVSALISLSVPSAAPLPWSKVPKDNWAKGVLDVNLESASKQASSQVYEERDLLRAVSKARRSTNFVMIASSVVARGLPLRIPDRLFFDKFGFPGCIGCIDGTHVGLIRPHEHEERFFNRKHYHSRNVQIICDCDLNIISIDASFGGATHDSHIWKNHELNRHLQGLHHSGENVWLLGDSGYALRPWLLTPIVNAANGSPEEHYTKVHCSTRNTVERCIGVLKARWRCLLAHRVLHYNHHTVAKIINACAVLHNMANQARLPVPPLSLEDIENDQLLQDVGSESAAPVTLEGETHQLERGRNRRALIVQRLWGMRRHI